MAQMAPVRPWSLLQACPRPPPTPPDRHHSHAQTLPHFIEETRFDEDYLWFQKKCRCSLTLTNYYFSPNFSDGGGGPKQGDPNPSASNPRPASPRQGSRDKGHGGTACPPDTGEEVADWGGKGELLR